MGLLFSGIFAAVHSDHDCPGEGCPVCLQIQGAVNFLRQCKSAAFHDAFSQGAFLAVIFILRSAVFCFIPSSSVRLKVKMNM
jgi:hypothetical protein